MDLRLLRVQKAHGRFRNVSPGAQVVGVAISVIKIRVVRVVNEFAFLGNFEPLDPRANVRREFLISRQDCIDDRGCASRHGIVQIDSFALQRFARRSFCRRSLSGRGFSGRSFLG